MSSEARFPAWAWWIIGAVSILAISILIFSVVLGIRAGQQQIEIQRRQQIGIALQRAIDLQAEGNLQAALEQYQKVLVLDSSNAVAQQGIKNLLALAAAGTPVAGVAAPAANNIGDAASVTPTAAGATDAGPTATVAAAQAASPLATAVAGIPVTVTSGAAAGAAAGYFDKAQTAIKAGRWQEALDNLSQLQKADATFRRPDVNDQLFNVYVNLATEKDNANKLEEALQLYDQALQLRPDAADVRRERTLISTYLDVLTYVDADWPKAIELLDQLYTQDRQYRDVETRLLDARTTYGDELANKQQWCQAASQYDAAMKVSTTPTLTTKHDAAQVQCRQVGDVSGGNLAGGAGLTATTGFSLPAALALGSPSSGTSLGSGGMATATPASVAAPATGLPGGQIIYSALEPVTGRSQILAETIGRAGPPQLLLQDAAQPTMRADGARMAFRNLRRDMAGLSSFDPATGLLIRFTEYAEDSQPSWNPQGTRLVFASNREGDRRWRLYLVWAEANGATDTLGFGESPAWSPVSDQIAYRGCDASGNNCGIWLMNSSGGNRSPLTNVVEDDRPAWSPDGSFLVFMNNTRSGNNYDIYRVDVNSRQTTRLTESSAIDVLPTVSPDGEWVTFLSNRDGSWKLWAVPSTGGQARLIAPVSGDIGDWTNQKLQWTN